MIELPKDVPEYMAPAWLGIAMNPKTRWEWQCRAAGWNMAEAVRRLTVPALAPKKPKRKERKQ